MNDWLSSEDPAVLTKTLTELESDDWGDPPPNATTLITTAHRLRHVPIGQLSPGDLRLMLGQQIGAKYLLDLALDLLDRDPMVEDLYAGDLWITVIQRGHEFDEATPNQRARIDSLARQARFTANELLRALAAYDAE